MTAIQEELDEAEIKIAAAYGRLQGEAKWCVSTGKVTLALADVVRQMEEALEGRRAMIAKWTQGNATKEVK